MELLLGNLAFSLVVRVGGVALGLAFMLWIAFRLAKPFMRDMKKRHRRIAKRAAVIIWLAVVGITTLSVLAGNSPRITVDDHTRPTQQQTTDAEVQNLNPHTKTDDERVQETRDIGLENAREAE